MITNRTVDVIWEFNWEMCTRQPKGLYIYYTSINKITGIIGESGAWQLKRIAIVFFISIPGKKIDKIRE